MKKFILGLVSLLALTTSCSKHDFDSENPYSQVNKEATFADDFNSTFGVSAKDYVNHDWGMNIVPLVDLTNKTRAAQPNGNQWGTTDDNSKYIDWPKPNPITDAEREAVLAVFNQKGATSYKPLVHWENYFVQQVYTGPNGHKMNELASITDMVVKQWWPLEYQHTGNYTDDIINNFNAGNCTAYDGCMLMWFSSTEDFSFKTSQSGGERIYGHWRMECINGNYYVGFDHEAWRQAPANANEEDKRDYIYNDWIVKIVPGKGEEPPVPVDYVRVMCEDLGVNHSDFDYNDVVFDVKFFKNGNTITADIVLRAAGGTLPLTIGGNEVHNLYGVSTTTMVNTARGKHNELGTRSFTVTLNGNYTNAHDAINALPVVVRLENGQTVHLTTNPGSPAEMFAVPVGTDWADERVSIRNKYPMFVDWITNSGIKWYN
jgi:hypothetical protein